MAARLVESLRDKALHLRRFWTKAEARAVRPLSTVSGTIAGDGAGLSTNLLTTTATNS